MKNKDCDDRIHREIVTISDVIMQAYKTEKQVSHTPKMECTTFRTQREWPLQLSIGTAIHQSTRRRQLVDFLHSYGLSVDYSRILQLETQLANAICDRYTNEGMYIPPGLVKGRFIFFAIDNSDFNEDTPDGKHTSHATATAEFLNKCPRLTTC